MDEPKGDQKRSVRAAYDKKREDRSHQYEKEGADAKVCLAQDLKSRDWQKYRAEGKRDDRIVFLRCFLDRHFETMEYLFEEALKSSGRKLDETVKNFISKNLKKFKENVETDSFLPPHAIGVNGVYTVHHVFSGIQTPIGYIELTKKGILKCLINPDWGRSSDNIIFDFATELSKDSSRPGAIVQVMQPIEKGPKLFSYKEKYWLDFRGMDKIPAPSEGATVIDMPPPPVSRASEPLTLKETSSLPSLGRALANAALKP